MNAHAGGASDIAVNAVITLAKRRFRYSMLAVLVLCVAVGALVYSKGTESSTDSARYTALQMSAATHYTALQTSYAKLQTSYAQLQAKSSEQTTAEVQLRGIANNAVSDLKAVKATNAAQTANHDEAVQLFCLILTPEHVTSPLYRQYCLSP